MVTTLLKLKDASSLEGKLWQIYSVLKVKDIILPTKFCIAKLCLFQ